MSSLLASKRVNAARNIQARGRLNPGMVHAPWLADCNALIEYIASLPDSDNLRMVLARIDVQRPYQPGNLAWYTREELRAREQRGSKIMYGGVRYTSAEFFAKFASHMQKRIVYRRILEGWSPEEILLTPYNHTRNKPLQTATK